MGWKGPLRFKQAVQCRVKSEAHRERREPERLRKQLERTQELERATREVQTYESYIDLLLSVHKECSDSLDWQAIRLCDPPIKPTLTHMHEDLARAELDGSEPAVFDEMPECAEAEPDELVKAIEEAGQADEREYEEALRAYEQEYADWEASRELASNVLAGDINAYCTAIRQTDPFGDINRLGLSIEVRFENSSLAEATLHVNSKEVIPSDVKRLSKSGRLSVKRMSKSRFYELYQDYVCGCVLRIARELFALLPIEMVIVNAVVNALETRSGYLEKQPSYVGEQPILSVAIPRKMLEELNFEALDPSDSMSNFAHRMAFKKTQGFGTVEALSAPDLQTIMFYVFPRYCCRCLGPSECTIEVDSQHDRISVPVCKKCFDTVSSYRAFRRHIKVSLYLFALCTLAVALFNEQSDLLLPAWICAFLSKYLFVLMKFLTEPARFDKYGMLKFKNEEYQSLFDQANLYQVPL